MLCAIGGNCLLSGAELFLALGNGTGQDGYFPVFIESSDLF